MTAKRIMEDGRVRRTIRRLVFEILERNRGADNLVVVGIRERGLALARHLGDVFAEVEGREVPVVALDVAPFRDDRPVGAPSPTAGDVPDLLDRDVILVDDVLYTGRTARAALDAVVRHGRPRTIQLVALVDRGHREYPIQADYVGVRLPTKHRERVVVELSGRLAVHIEE